MRRIWPILATMALIVPAPSVAQDAPAPAAKADPAAFAGHYYLSGVMETGSELLLRADGSFEWYLSYGALDQTAQGTWSVEGDAIILATAPVQADTPLFSYLASEPWSAEAEQQRRRRLWAEAEAVVRARCPFLPEPEVEAAIAPAIDNAIPAPAPALRERAAAALRAAMAARAQVELLARRWISDKVSPAGGDAGIDRILAAQSAWSAARYTAFEAARQAALPKPSLADPVLPGECTLPKEEDIEPPPSQLGVRVTDLASQQPLRKVQVLLHFADGSVERLMTGSGGFAFVPRAAAQAVSATLHIDGAPKSDKAIAFPPLDSGILRFAVDLQQLATPPFATLRLRIAGKALLPEGFPNGRYERQP